MGGWEVAGRGSKGAETSQFPMTPSTHLEQAASGWSMVTGP